MELNETLSNEQIIQLWFHYEEIAMHFNELIIQYRLQLFAALGAVGTLFAYLINNKDEIIDKSFLYAIVSSLLVLVLCAGAVLDIFYYQKLLHGSVNAIIELEDNFPIINMSTHIKAVASSTTIVIAYLMLGVPATAYALISWCNFFKKRDN